MSQLYCFILERFWLGARSKESLVKQALEVLKKFILFALRPAVLLTVLVVSFGVAIYYSEKSELSATTSMSLTYQEAAEGLNPNGTRYNTNELYDTELLRSVIDSLGISSSLTADELSEDLYIEPARQSGGDKENYICTTWNITITLKEKIPHVSVGTILDVLCQKYKEQFLDEYSERWSAVEFSSDTLLSNEPYVRLQQLSMKATELDTYLTKRVNASEGQDTAVDGTDFSTLSRQVKNVLNYDVENLQSVVLRDGISSNTTLLLNTLSYKLKLDKKTYDTQMAYYDANNAGISQYDESMSAVVMIPTVDESNEFYMSKTKTALDELASSADTSLEEATSYNSEMENTKYLSTQIQSGTTDSDRSIATSIQKIEDTLNEIEAKLSAVDKNYVRHKTQSYIQFVDVTPSFSQNIGFKKIVVIDGGILVLLFVTSISVEGKKKKNSRKG